ncbi:hypothetical protein V8F06_004776 [Rhypophila decipiens]
MPESTWRLDGHWIRGTVYPKGSSTPRESSLDLDLCCRLLSTGLTEASMFRLTYIRAPADLAHPDAEQLTTKLSQDKHCSITYLGNGILHSRKVMPGWFWDSVYDSDFDLNTCLRFSDDGHLEFALRRRHSKVGKGSLQRLKSYEESARRAGGLGPVGSELEKHLDALMKQFQDWIMAKNLEPMVREFMTGTYVDASGKLIRRGS